MSDQGDIIAQFIELTQVPKSVAEVLLERNNYDVQLALDDFYNGGTQQQGGASSSSAEHQSTGTSSASNSRQSSAAPKPTTATGKPSRFKSFGELVNGSGDDDEQNFFAGGAEGSGINVENPNAPRNLVQDLLRKAEQGGGHPDRANEDNDSGSSKREPRFDGVGYKLGDSVTPSSQVGSRNFAPKKLEKAIREITFWKEGFQVGDGPLYRYDDPANSTYLAELNAGRAPVSLLNVEYGQDVDVNVTKRTDEEFKAPKRKLTGFHGEGQRLGSPVSADYIPPSEPSVETAKEEEEKEEEEKIPEEGDATVQIRLADGSRIVKKFQSTTPVQTLYSYVESLQSSAREFTLNHAFPVKVIDNLQESIKEAGLVNSVVVQRWV